MSQSYSKWLRVLALTGWIFAGFFSASFLTSGLFFFLTTVGIDFNTLNSNVLSTATAAVLYLCTLLIVIGLPWLVREKKTTLKDVGLDRLMSWLDIFITPLGLIVYLLLSAFLVYFASKYIPWFDTNQAQDTGFERLNQQYEFYLAFITLVIIAPVAEEALFRGYMFGNLKKMVPTWAAILVTSLLFGIFHGAWNVGVDTFALSIVLCLLREITGGIWSSILLHMTKNGIAFYILFLNPTLLTTLGG
ncbi:hypothetical protein CVV43_01175 [Candidatus Saccharibacteria bacterium HGW-Saccharibacteria-1]|jgi:hypothetical protein|nr:MAG: hypothetical protein CVV43_01175 [Candidatus Saccharibacteria bacterium HGW-Saccharibacteria-1]